MTLDIEGVLAGHRWTNAGKCACDWRAKIYHADHRPSDIPGQHRAHVATVLREQIEADVTELAVLREFWRTFWDDITTVECACGLSAYEHDDNRRLEIAQDKVATFYETRAAQVAPSRVPGEDVFDLRDTASDHFDRASIRARRRATKVTDEMDALIEALKDEQAARCAYGTREGDGRTCDCKYGAPTFGLRGEMTGCPELRAAVWTIARGSSA